MWEQEKPRANQQRNPLGWTNHQRTNYLTLSIFPRPVDRFIRARAISVAFNPLWASYRENFCPLYSPIKGDQLGSIETGKWVDLVISDSDYMSVQEEDISEILPLMTMMGGRFIFLRTDFSNEYDLKPASAEIGTREELRARRPR